MLDRIISCAAQADGALDTYVVVQLGLDSEQDHATGHPTFARAAAMHDQLIDAFIVVPWDTAEIWRGAEIPDIDALEEQLGPAILNGDRRLMLPDVRQQRAMWHGLLLTLLDQLQAEHGDAQLCGQLARRAYALACVLPVTGRPQPLDLTALRSVAAIGADYPDVRRRAIAAITQLLDTEPVSDADWFIRVTSG